ncbi:hypothetical protein ABZV60_31300, partial [Streptomyces sp. NPDC004787]
AGQPGALQFRFSRRCGDRGATPAETDAVERALDGVRIPAALRALWALTSGDDGAVAAPGSRPVGCLPGNRALIPLDAVDAVAAEQRRRSGTAGWRPGWIPVISRGPADHGSGLFLDAETGRLGRWNGQDTRLDDDLPDTLGTYLEGIADTLEHPALATGDRPGPVECGTLVWASRRGD